MSSWLDRLQPASFRNVTFLWEQVEKSGGRRVVVHEYPFQDEPYAEDLGLKYNEFKLNAYFIGKNYDQKAIAFEKVLEQKGEGELVTPLQGSMQAQLMTWTRTDTTVQGGIARFQLTFIRTGQVRYPQNVKNPTSTLITRHESLQGMIIRGMT